MLAVALVLPLACAPSLPSLEEQQKLIHRQEFPSRQLTPEAFLLAWGPPSYEYEVKEQFFPLRNGQYVPRFRVPLGEAPPDWDMTIVFGRARFLTYADRGLLLGFLENRLVYRETLTADQLHALGRAWQRELRFRTGLEREGAGPASGRPPSP